MSFSKVTNFLNPFSRILEPFRSTPSGEKIDYADVICAAFTGDESTVRKGLRTLNLFVLPKVNSSLLNLLAEKGIFEKPKNDGVDKPLAIEVNNPLVAACNNPLVAACFGNQKRIVNMILEDEKGIQLLHMKIKGGATTFSPYLYFRDRTPFESLALSKIIDGEIFQRLLDTGGPIPLTDDVAYFGKPEIIKMILQQPEKIARIVKQTLFPLLDADTTSIVLAYCDQPVISSNALVNALSADTRLSGVRKDAETIELLLRHGADPRQIVRPYELNTEKNLVEYAKYLGHSEEIITKLDSRVRQLEVRETKLKRDCEVDEKACEDLWADL